MRIDGNNRPNGVARRASPDSARGQGEVFQLQDGKQASRAATTAATAGLSGVAALLALQAVDGESPSGGRLRHGHDMLDILEDIKIGLLSGSVPAAKLESLIDNLKRRPARIEGEAVEHVLDEIEVRARVELAKLGREAA